MSKSPNQNEKGTNSDEHQFKELTAIDKETTNWNAQVTVICLKPPRIARNNKTKFQKLVLADQLGNCVDAVMYDGDVERYKDIIKQDKTFIISNAIVALANLNFSSEFSKDSDYSWTINDRTKVTPVECNPLRANPFKKNQRFANYDDLKIGANIHIILVIVNAQPQRQTPLGAVLTEYVGIDKEYNEIIITLWDDATTDHTHAILSGYPVVALINFAVKDYHGLSLSSNSSSLVVTSMDNPQFTEMEEWRMLNKETVDSIITRKDIHSGVKFAAVSNTNLPEININDLLQSEPMKKYNVTAKAQFDSISKSFLYNCCPKCHTKTYAAYGERFMCMSSKCKDYRVAIRRFVFGIQLIDNTGKIDVTVFGEMGVKIFKMDEDSFYKKYYPDWTIEKEKLNSDLESTTWKTRIYKKESEYQGNRTTSYVLDYMIATAEKTLDEVNVTNEQVPAIQCSPTYVEPSKEEPKKVNDSTVNITLDPNIKVKIEEVEDARRDAAFKARTDPKNWVQDEIIHIDSEVQEAHQQTKVSIRGEVAGAGSKKRGRPCGSRNKPRNGAGKLSKGAIKNEGAGKGSKKRARRPTSLKKQNDGEEDKQSKGLREGEGGG